jgi:hypothetical protein
MYRRNSYRENYEMRRMTPITIAALFSAASVGVAGIAQTPEKAAPKNGKGETRCCRCTECQRRVEWNVGYLRASRSR